MAKQRPFRFGVHTSDAQTGDAWATAARRYEELGFSTLLLRDHFDRQLAPIVAMTAAACATNTLRVGCLVFANDYRHPLVLAKELATLDRLSNGRVEIGLGAGWMGSDYEQAGVPFDAPRDRVDRLQETVAIMKAFFAGDAVNHAGEHYAITGHEMYPQPVQQPHPPFLLVAGGPRMTKFAATQGDIVAINPATKSNEAWAEQNLADATDAAVDQKIDAIRAAAGARYDQIEIQIVAPYVIPTDDREGTAEAIAGALPSNDPALDLSAKSVLASPYVLIGTETQICETLIERRERWDLSYYVFNDDSIDAAALDATARGLRAEPDAVDVGTAVVDLAQPADALLEAIRRAIGTLEIGLLVANAAWSPVGPFLDSDLAGLLAAIDINCRAPVVLAHELGRQMVDRGRGGIIVMSSLAAETGTAQVALYSATKAFDLVLAEGLWYELRDRGVDVVAIRPGSTRTPGWQATQPPDGDIEGVMEPADVVREALAALGTTPSITAGSANRKAEALFRSMPRRDVIELMSGITSRLVPPAP